MAPRERLDPADSPEHPNYLLRRELQDAAVRAGWKRVDAPSTVEVLRSSGDVEHEWEVIAARVQGGELWCRAWKQTDPRGMTKDLMSRHLSGSTN